MQVSTSAYYAWTKQPETTEKTKEKKKLETKIRQIFDDFKQTYGSRRLVGELRKAGFKVERYKVRTLMKKLGLKPRYPKRFKVTTDSHHNEAISPNILFSFVPEVLPISRSASTEIYRELPDDNLLVPARQDFSRKLKWEPSDFSGEKLSWRLLPSAARVRPASAAAHNSPSVRCSPLACANHLTPCRMALHFDYASATAPTPSKRPALRLRGGRRTPLHSRYASCTPSMGLM
jgi:hypothetical protein